MGRRTRLAQSLWLAGREADALHPTPCAGKRAKPATALYGWVIRHGERVRNANFLYRWNCVPNTGWITRATSWKLNVLNWGVGAMAYLLHAENLNALCIVKKGPIWWTVDHLKTPLLL